MTDNIEAFPGTTDSTKSPDEQPEPNVIAFCEDLVIRAKAGQIRAIAVALVEPGRTTADGWRRSEHGADCAHELMAAITYLQLRYGNQVNEDSARRRGR